MGRSRRCRPPLWRPGDTLPRSSRRRRRGWRQPWAFYHLVNLQGVRTLKGILEDVTYLRAHYPGHGRILRAGGHGAGPRRAAPRLHAGGGRRRRGGRRRGVPGGAGRPWGGSHRSRQRPHPLRRLRPEHPARHVPGGTGRPTGRPEAPLPQGGVGRGAVRKHGPLLRGLPRLRDVGVRRLQGGGPGRPRPTP